MADHSKPLTTSTYANFVTELDGRFDDLTLGLDPATTSPTNLATNAIRFSSAVSKWQKYNGTTWADLSSSYAININGTVGATTPAAGSFTDLSSTGNTTLGNASGDTVTITGTIQPGVVVSGSSTTDMFRITQTGTGNAFVVEDAANPDSTPFVVDSSGKVLVGTTTPKTTGVGSAVMQIFGGTAPLSFYREADSTTPINLEFAKARAAGAILASGDTIGRAYFSGSDGTNQIPAAYIDAAVDGTPGNNDMPGRLVFSTTADGASTPTERMRITSGGNVGIGTTSLTNVNLRVSNNITGSTTAYGVYEDGAIQSDVTSIGAYYASAGSMASGTLSNLFHYYATQGTIGATVSTQTAFVSSSGLIGATNNYAFFAGNSAAVTAGKTAYGFYSNVNTATGGGTTYGFYAAGTAVNYFNGNVGIGTTSPDGTLEVSGTATTAYITKYASETASTPLVIRKSRGTEASPIVISAGDNLGSINFEGYDGANFSSAAQILAQSDGTPGGTDMPGRLLLRTTPDGSATVATAVTIDSSQVTNFTNGIQVNSINAYALKGISYLSGSGTYTTPSKVRAIYVECVGGGGGGGGVDGQGASTSAVSRSGGGGAYCAKLITSPAATYTYAVGAGGAAGASGDNDGTVGGTTTFTGTGTSLSAVGGNQGLGHTGTSGNSGSLPGGTAGTATGGDINLAGSRGGARAILSGIIAAVSQQGDCPMFGGARAQSAENAGFAGLNFGCAGSGAATSGVTTNYAGGAGAAGTIRITEYY